MSERQDIARKELIRYGALALPLAFAGMPLYVHAPDYFATEFGLSLSFIGVVLLGLRFVDAVQDPFIGRLSDRVSERRGTVIITAAIVLVCCFGALFQPVGMVTVWFALFMFLATTAFSVLSINLNTLGGLWSRELHQKTRITSYREAFGLVGLLVAVLLPSLLMQFFSKQASFLGVAAVLFVFVVAALYAFSGWLRRHQEVLRNSDAVLRVSFLTSIRRLPYDTRYFYLVYGVSMLASAMPAVLVLFFIRDRLDAEAYAGLFLSLYFLSGVLGMPIWQYLSRKWNQKHRAWIASMLLAVVSFVWAYFLSVGDVWEYAVICIISGLALGADMALPPSILADHIQYQARESEASFLFGLFTFIAKLVLALASVLTLTLLDAVGFVAGRYNSDAVLQLLSLCYAAIPCVIKLIAVALLWRAPLIENGGTYVEVIHSPVDGGRPHA